MKRKEMNKGAYTAKKKNHIEKYAALVLVEDTNEQGDRQNVDVKV